MGDPVELPLRRTPDDPAPRRRDPRPHQPLWRELVGAELREERVGRGERLADVAARAGVAPQYLSEVERGLKDPSSEMLAAMAEAVDLTLGELAVRVARAASLPSRVVGLASRPVRSGSPAGPTASASSGPLCLAA